MKISLKKLLPFTLLVPLFLGCALAEKFKQRLEESAAPKVLTSSDGSCQITVPGVWEKVPPKEHSILMASNFVDDIHLTILREVKSDFTEDTSLDDFVTLAQQNMHNRIDEVGLLPAEPLRISGYQAQKFEATGTMQKLKLRYLFVYVWTGEEVFEICIWTSPSRFEKNRASMMSILNTFKVITPGPGDLETPETDEPPPPPAKPAKHK